jgi:alginate O-acetyltransferase complex protein AlgI
MLFNSFGFIFVFLPITLAVYFLLGRLQRHQVAIAWLVASSLFFYGWWNPAYLGLLIGSILFNYAFGAMLARRPGRDGHWLLVLGVGANLALLGYFKYSNFFLENISLLTGAGFDIGQVILPLGISFITFQKIAYLVDAWQGKTREYNFMHFCLFVTFFPQLIAGPIVHHRDVMPQFARRSLHVFHHENFSVGASIFVIGLFKKVVIADSLAQFATPVFAATGDGITLTFFEAWVGALAYTFQLYFDFSGYSDMAIGLARMFGVKLPLNFHSPYKATSIIDFWRRWHMTLSRFLRDYLYIPLGGSRKGPARRYLNLLLTMLLGGLWHGAGWTFVIWGGLHGFYLLINHAWRGLLKSLGLDGLSGYRAYLVLAWLLTFLAVVIGWVYFRAPNAAAAVAMLQSMTGQNGVDLAHAFGNELLHRDTALKWIFGAAVIAWFLPNTQQVFARHAPALDSVSGGRMQWQPSVRWAMTTNVLALIALYHMNRVSEFLYFQF